MGTREITIILDSIEGIRKDIGRLYDRLGEKPCGRNTERIRTNEREITELKKSRFFGVNVFFKVAVVLISLMQVYLMYKGIRK